MVITVEPGCYFNPALLKPALEDKAQAAFLVRDRVLSLLVCFLSNHGVLQVCVYFQSTRPLKAISLSRQLAVSCLRAGETGQEI